MDLGLGQAFSAFFNSLFNTRIFNYIIFFYGGLMTGFFVMMMYAYAYDKEYHRKLKKSKEEKAQEAKTE